MIEQAGHLLPIPLIIIWGSRGRTTTTGEGNFYCPSCRTTRNYERKPLSKYFTLYFIPLFETEKIAEYIECRSCHSEYKPEVLDLSANKQANEFLEFVHKQLEAGLPVGAIAEGLVENGASKETAAQILFIVTSGKLARCPACQLTFAQTLAYCSRCGHRLEPIVNSP